MDSVGQEDGAEAVEGLIKGLFAQGLDEPRVLQALKDTPRQVFVPDLFQDRAWEDSALPIAAGQTISQPSMVGLMTMALNLDARHRVLEIGTGSGYQAAVLARLCRFVYTVERYRSLLLEAEARFRSLELGNIITRHADGLLGWPETAPFDRILVTAAMDEEPVGLLSQLHPKGILVAPVGRGSVQALMRYSGDGEGRFIAEVLGETRFVPLIPGMAKEMPKPIPDSLEAMFS